MQVVQVVQSGSRAGRAGRAGHAGREGREGRAVQAKIFILKSPNPLPTSHSSLVPRHYLQLRPLSPIPRQAMKNEQLTINNEK